MCERGSASAEPVRTAAAARAQGGVDVVEVVLALVHGVAPQPEHGALGGLGEVVDAAALPLGLVEALEGPGEHLGRHS